MPFKIRAQWNRKNGGDPRFCSEGSSVEYEQILDDSFATPERQNDLIDRTRALQALAKHCVDVELALAATKYRAEVEAERQAAAKRHDDAQHEAAEELQRTGRREPEVDEDYDADDYESTGRSEPPARRDERPRERPAESRRERPREPERPAPQSRGHDRRNDRRSRGASSGGGNGYRDWRDSDAIPNASQLYGFVRDHDKDYERDGKTPTADWFKQFAKDEKIRGMFKEWSDDDAAFAVREWRKDHAAARSNGAAY